MYKKRKSNFAKLLLNAAFSAVVIFIAAACPTGTVDEEGEKKTNTLVPNKPVVTKIQNGSELLLADLTQAAGTDADWGTDGANVAMTVAFVWEADGAKSFNVYWADQNSQPITPNKPDLLDPVCIATGLEPETEYFFWIEAVNPNGKTVTTFSQTTAKKGAQADGGLERGDYPRNMKVIPGNGSLTVSWDLPDRVGWHEIYYAKKGVINHVDAYNNPFRVKWDQAPFAANTAYKDNGQAGYTGELYPYESPEVSGMWRGYWIGKDSKTDGDTRPVIGINDFGKTAAELGAAWNPTFAYYPPAGAFPYIFESWRDGGDNALPLLVPYKPLDAAFKDATPWNPDANGPGTISGKTYKYHSNTVTITGLTNGTEYEVWVRVPNANGERGYGYVEGTPGAAANLLPAPKNVQAQAPEGSLRDLRVTWLKVEGAENYRIYNSQFDYEPTTSNPFVRVPASAPAEYLLTGLVAGKDYYVWVVAESGGLPGTIGKAAIGQTGTPPSTGKIGDKIIAGTNQKVKTVVYVEVNDHNPLNAGSYILEDGTYLFDHVVLFAANIRNRDCSLESGHGCTKSGPHLHLNENVRYLLENRNKYIVPLQEKGIKVILGLLGDHDGIGFGTMNDVDRATFIADVKQDVDYYQLDGIDFDDEWASKEDWEGWTNNYATISPTSIWPYPVSTWGWPTSVTVYRNPEMGTGLDGIKAGNGTRTANSAEQQRAMWLPMGENYYKTVKAAREAMPDKIISLYEYNTGRYITQGGTANGEATMENLSAQIDFALQPWYNQYYTDSANGLPHSKYSPFGMDLSGKAYSSQNGAPNPPIVSGGSEQGSMTVFDYSTRYKTASATANTAYGVLYFYGLEQSSSLLKRESNDSTRTVTKEAYMSIMSNIVFGQDVVLTAEGGDYRKDW